MEQTLLREFAYNVWANQRAIASVRTIQGLVAPSLDLLSHMANAERIWLSRIQGVPGPRLGETRTLDEVESLFAENYQGYREILTSETGPDLARLIDYRSLDGVPFQTALGDILRQVLSHGCYHRGQLASRVKVANGTPAATDFILYARESVKPLET